MAGAETSAQELSLGAFANTGSTEQDYSLGFARMFAGRHLAFLVSALKPGGAVMMDKGVFRSGLGKVSVYAHVSNISMSFWKANDLRQLTEFRPAFAKI